MSSFLFRRDITEYCCQGNKQTKLLFFSIVNNHLHGENSKNLLFITDEIYYKCDFSIKKCLYNGTISVYFKVVIHIFRCSNTLLPASFPECWSKHYTWCKWNASKPRGTWYLHRHRTCKYSTQEMYSFVLTLQN